MRFVSQLKDMFEAISGLPGVKKGLSGPSFSQKNSNEPIEIKKKLEWKRRAGLNGMK